MLQDIPLIPNRILEADLRTISRPNINFDRSRPPFLHIPRTTGSPDSHKHGLGRRQAHITDLEHKVREETPLLTPTPTPTSINWWPYPPWGQSTTPSQTSSFAAAAAVASTDAPASTVPLSATTSNATPDTTTRAAVISIPTLPSTDSLPSNPRVHAATSSHFNILYLIPVFVAVGLALVALSGTLGYRWYSRRRARKGGPSDGFRSRGRAGSSFVPGPPYIPMLNESHDLEGAQVASPTSVGSPSKNMRYGARGAARSWLSAVARATSRRGSTRSSSIPPSQGSTARAAATPSHSRLPSESPSRARSRGSTTVTSPGSLSDEENVPYESIRHTSIRRGILERLQRGTISRGPSRRTLQTYLSAPSAYSGTHTEDSRAPSAVPSSSTYLPRDTNTDWIPGSGFRIVEEAISSPPPSTTTPTSVSVAGLPGQTARSAWDDRAAIRQAVDAHPGERWLAWTRSWASSPPPAQDRFTAVPTRRRDVGAALPRSPPQLTSDSLQSTLTFSPSASLAVPRAASTNTAGRRSRAQQQQQQSPQPLLARQAAVRGDSRASSIALGEGHGTPAMRYAARQTALSRVEDILARSYSSRDDLAPAPTASPNGANKFGAASSTTLASTEEREEDAASTAGIVHRLAVAEASAIVPNRRRQR